MSNKANNRGFADKKESLKVLVFNRYSKRCTVKLAIISITIIIMTLFSACSKYPSDVTEVSDSFIVPIAEEYGIDDLRLDEINTELGVICYYKSEAFKELSDEDKFNLIFSAKEDAKKKEYPYSDCKSGEYKNEKNITDYRVVSDGVTYKVSTNLYDYYVLRASNQSETLYDSDIKYGGEWASGGGSKTKCSYCGGSGTVKYNYGESDLEAYLDGEEPYTFGPCPYCNGTGYED